MTGGEKLYLALTLVSFAVFTLVLAYESWQDGNSQGPQPPTAERAERQPPG